MHRKSAGGPFTIILLLGASYVFAKFQGGFVSWFLFYSFLPIALYSLLQYLFVFKGLSIRRTLSKKTFTDGESLKVTLNIENPFRFPLVYLRIEDSLAPRLRWRTADYGQVIHPWFKKEFELNYEVISLPRGVYYWHDIKLHTGDLFGFIKKEKVDYQWEEIVVYPKVQDIRSWHTLNLKNTGMTYTINQHAEDMTSIRGTKEYVPGDRLSRIHWKASARTNRLQTKEFEMQLTNDFMFFLDRETAAYGDEEHPLFEKAVSLTASLIQSVLKHRFSAGLVSYGTEYTLLNMSRDLQQMHRTLEHLARIKADASLPFIKTVLREIAFLPRGTTVVIISPSLKQSLLQMMSELSYRKIKIEFFWIKNFQESIPQQQEGLRLLTKERVSYTIITDQNFNTTVAGGE